MLKNKDFKFGIESEYLLVDANTIKPLWQDTLEFATLNDILETIPLEDLPSLAGLELEPPHKKLMPFAVEGYGLVNAEFIPQTILPKGIEIRTPIANSIEHCLSLLKALHSRLQFALNEKGYLASALSHHPIKNSFSGPQNKRRHDYWRWSMEVMTTYGPDLNISVPSEVTANLDLKDFNAKVNYYTPALTTFSLASPFCEGQPWRIKGKIGKSLRTYRRSLIAPAIELHPEEMGRMEFKSFEMSWRLEDFHAYFLLWLTLVLDNSLRGRSSDATRVYDLGLTAIDGWNAPDVKERAHEVLDAAYKILPSWGFNTAALEILTQRLEKKICPADEILEIYNTRGSLERTLEYLSVLVPEKTIIPVRPYSPPQPYDIAT